MLTHSSLWLIHLYCYCCWDCLQRTIARLHLAVARSIEDIECERRSLAWWQLRLGVGVAWASAPKAIRIRGVSSESSNWWEFTWFVLAWILSLIAAVLEVTKAASTHPPFIIMIRSDAGEGSSCLCLLDFACYSGRTLRTFWVLTARAASGGRELADSIAWRSTFVQLSEKTARRILLFLES